VKQQQRSVLGRLIVEVVGPGTIVGIATGYGLDGPGIEYQWRARFSGTLPNGPGAHPVPYAVGTRSFPGLKRPGRGVAPTPYLAPRLKKK